VHAACPDESRLVRFFDDRPFEVGPTEVEAEVQRHAAYSAAYA
jgi:hypothetical protein